MSVCHVSRHCGEGFKLITKPNAILAEACTSTAWHQGSLVFLRGVFLIYLPVSCTVIFIMCIFYRLFCVWLSVPTQSIAWKHLLP